MGIKTVPHPPYSPDVAPCDFWLFPKLRGCDYEPIEEMKESCDERSLTHSHKKTSWGLPKVVGMVQVHCSWRRLLRRGLESHMCTINKSAYTQKKSGNLFNDPRTYMLNPFTYIKVADGCATRYPTSIKSATFQSHLKAPLMSSHIDEL